MTANDLITAAFADLSVYAPGDTLSPDAAADGIRRLNNMMGSWALQTLTIPVVVREVFLLTANVGTYTIGPGGDFDTSRPVALEGAGLLMNATNAAVSVTSLTSSGNVATATAAVHGFGVGYTITVKGASPAAYNGTVDLTAVTTNTFSYEFEGGTTPATGTITAWNTTNLTTPLVEIPRAVSTDDAYQAIQVKDLTNAMFTNVYYQSSFFGGLGQITLWPVPNTAIHALVLYRSQQLSTFTDLTTDYTFPPGYAEALEYNLVLRLARPYGQPLADDLVTMARTSLATIKRPNTKMTDLPTDPALTRDRRFGYNIQTGQ